MTVRAGGSQQPRGATRWLVFGLGACVGCAPIATQAVKPAPPEAAEPPVVVGDLDDSAVDAIDLEPERARPRSALTPLDAARAATCAAWQPIAERVGGDAGLDPMLLLAIAWVESAFVASGRSSAGARGPMQLLPSTARAFGCDEPEAVECAMRAAAAYLQRLLHRFDGSVLFALSAYNTGGVRAGRAFRAGELPPNQWYVERVLGARALLQRNGCTAPASGEDGQR